VQSVAEVVHIEPVGDTDVGPEVEERSALLESTAGDDIVEIGRPQDVLADVAFLEYDAADRPERRRQLGRERVVLQSRDLELGIGEPDRTGLRSGLVGHVEPPWSSRP